MNKIVGRLSKKPTVRDVASRAGVSIGTVSRVLNGNLEVDSKYVEKVMAAVDKIGYQLKQPPRPHAAPSQLAGIAYLVDATTYSDVSTDPFQHNFLSGIERRAGNLGGHVIFSCCQESIQQGSVPPVILNRLATTAVIKVGVPLPEAWIKKIQEHVPVVLLMNRPFDPSIPSIMCNNYEAVHKAMAHLTELGHRQIAFLSEDEGSKTAHHHIERQSAYESISRNLGLAIPDAYVQTPRKIAGRDESLDDVIRRGLENLINLGKDCPTAVICAADTYALSLIRVAQQRGLRVPDDISVVGIMNTLLCGHSLPPLTSVAICEEEIGRAAVDLLAKQLEEPSKPAQHVIVGTKLVVRKSCAPVRS